jgi:hypothetical protein
MGRSGRRLVAVLAITGLGLALTACGGDDDDDTPAAAATDNGGDNTADNDNGGDNNTADNNTADNGDDGTIQVDSLKDIPDKCIDIFTDFLKQIEPVVKDVDWENADLSAMEDIGSQLDSVGSGLDDEMAAAGCDKYELSDNPDSMDTLIELAKDKAPGTVAYFEFIKQMSEGLGNITVPPSDGGDDGGGDTGGGSTAGLPTDCDGAKAYIEDLMGKYDTMMDMPMKELSDAGTVVGTLSTSCSPNEMQDFYTRDDVKAFLGTG